MSNEVEAYIHIWNCQKKSLKGVERLFIGLDGPTNPLFVCISQNLTLQGGAEGFAESQGGSLVRRLSRPTLEAHRRQLPLQREHRLHRQCKQCLILPSKYFFTFLSIANSGKLAHIRLIGTSLLKRQLNLHEIYTKELLSNYRPN